MIRLMLILIGMSRISYAVESITTPSDEAILNILHTSQLEAESITQKPSTPRTANKIVASTPVKQVTTNNTMPVVDVKTSNLDGIDNMANDILYKKRQLETEKLNAEIKKARMSDQQITQSQDQISIKETAQTVVTGVAIDSEGSKIAWLQFADGGSLTVNIGSQVGEYKVSSITMSNVTLTKKVGKKSKNIILKRSYVAMDKNNNRVISNTVFNPSPIVTGANVSSANQPFEVVPPIIK